MQSGHGNGRSISNGYGRIGPNHHGIAKQALIKKQDPKALPNGNVGPTSLNSMSRGEENRDRERQEARAQREMNTRVNLTPSPDKKEAMFAIKPNNSTVDKRFAMILGDFPDFAKLKNNHSVIGVDQQPPTPAPSSQIHDPDTYVLPPLQPVPVKNSTPTSHYGSSHRSHHQGAPNAPIRPKNQMPPSQIPSNKHPSNSQFAEEMKRSHKSGPGPGPGPGVSPGGRGPHQERDSSCKAAPLAINGRGRPHMINGAMKDPQILKIMSEMNDLDLKAPVSALLKTPRPDHQSSFTFPTPISNMQGFRVPMDPSAKGKPPDRPPTKLLDPNPNDEFALSEESDEEVSPSKIRKRDRGQKGELVNRRSKQNSLLSVSDDLLLSEDSEFEAGNLSRSTDSINAGGCPNSSGIPLHSTLNRSTGNILSLMDDSVAAKRPISPLKTSDESSNSEDSSGSDSESSSSEEEAKKSLPPSSPPPNDTNPWNLSTIFQQCNSVKPESPKQREVSSRGGYNEESLQDSDQDPVGQLPDHMTEVAPPVVTTVPRMRMHKNERPKTATHNSLSTDESSEEELPRPKVQRTAGVRSSSIHSNYNRSKHLPVVKNSRLIDPNLSDDTDEDEVATSKRPPVVSRQNSNPIVPKKLLKTPTLLSPRNELILQANKHASPKKTPKKLEMKRKESSKVKSRERIPSDSDTDGDVAIAALPKTVNGRISSRVPNMRHERKPSLSPLVAHRSPRTFDIGRSPGPLVTDAASFQRQKSCEIARFPEKPIKAPVPIGRTSTTPRSSDAELVAKPVKSERNRREEKENISKAEKRHRKNRHENEENTKPVKQDNLCEVAVDNSRLEVPQGVSPRLQSDSLNRKDQFNSNVSSNIIHYVNGVPTCNVSIPLSLIDRLPNKSHVKSDVVEKKVNIDKEVLEMRTRGGKGGGNGKSVETSSNINSSPNEDENKFETIKRRAICSIYKKRPSSLEPEKIKQKVKSESDPLVTKPLVNQVIEDNLTRTKQEAKLEVKEEVKSKVEPMAQHPESLSLKRRGSNTSLSSMNTVTSQSSRKHKKDKRKDRSNSREQSLAKDREKDVNSLSRRKRLSCSESEELPKNRISRELPVACENSQDTPSPPLKKLKKSPEPTQLTSPRDSRLSSPHPRSSQRNTSEERPHSSLSSDHYPHSNQSYHQSRSKSTPQSSQDKSVEESQIVSGVSMSEYQSLPSSEYESRVGGGSTYRSVEGGVSPMLPHDLLQASAQAEAYSHLHNSIPNSGMEYSSQMLSQVATSRVPAVNFISPFERIPPDIVKDHMFYLNKAKELKHQADRETHHRWLQAVMYLEAVLYFILTGESMESEPSNFIASVKMYTDTLKLIKHVSSPVFRKESIGSTDEITSRLNCILAILSLRCQSLLSLKLYSIKKGEFKEAMRNCNEYIRITMNGGRQMPGQASSTPSTCVPSTSTGSATPSGVPGSGTWGGSQRSAANNSPSSLSPTPSPAGSVGSEGSQSSSGYSTESVRQQRGGQVQSLLGQMTPPNFQPNPDLATIMKCFQVIQNLTQAHDMWTDADNSVNHNAEIRDFFIEVDHRMGPLTLNSSLRELVPYVNGAISALKKLPMPFVTPSL